MGLLGGLSPCAAKDRDLREPARTHAIAQRQHAESKECLWLN